MKIDFKKSLDSYKAKLGKFSIVVLPPVKYLMVDGEGDPNTSEDFSKAFEVIFPVAYTLKFMSKNDLGKDYVVAPPEALWWADDMTVFNGAVDKSKWKWTVLLYTPDWISEEMFRAAVTKVKSKGAPKSIDLLRFETLDEGMCVQVLYVGAYADEGPIIKKMHDEFIPEHNLIPFGKHHEIYLSDFRRTSPEKLKTIIRQPVARQ